MKTVFLIFLFLAFCINAGAVTNNYGAVPVKKIEIEKARRDLQVGERFVYDVFWNGIPVGEGSIEIKEMAEINGSEAYHIIAVAKSNDFLSKIYRVEDTLHSYIDKAKLCSLRFEKYQREGKYKADEVIIFDQKKHRGYYESLLNKSKKEFDIPARVQDLVSSFYYFRTLDVVPNSTIILDVNADEKNWKVHMDVLGTQELDIRRIGAYNVFCLEPKTPFKGVLARRGKTWVYFTADEKRVPVFIKIWVKFGYVTGILRRTE